MTAYYQDDHVILYLGDCFELRRWTSADVLITDPPYGAAYQSNRVPGRKPAPIAGDKDTATRDRALNIWHRWEPKPAIMFGKWNIPRPDGTRHVLIWDKGDDPGMGDLSLPWGNSFEEIYVIGKGWTGRRGSNVLRYNKPPVNNRDDHPTPKPLALMERLIRHAPPGIIADPFAGSGTTLVAAKALGRAAIGIEVDERHAEQTARRLSQEVLPIGL